MNKHFMADIETTGVNPETDEILQIAFVEVDWDGRKWVPGKSLDVTLFSDSQPQTPFAKKHMVDLYKKCNNTEHRTRTEIRNDIISFFKRCGVQGASEVYLMGQNASNFDSLFLTTKQILQPASYKEVDGQEVMIGDFHYRIFDTTPVINFVSTYLNNSDRKEVQDYAMRLDKSIELPEGKEHDALFDCYRQIKVLNGMYDIVRGVTEDKPVECVNQFDGNI